jgi:hypothetical protein
VSVNEPPTGHRRRNKRLEPMTPAAWTAGSLRSVGRLWHDAGSTAAGFAAHPRGARRMMTELPREAPGMYSNY